MTRKTYEAAGAAVAEAELLPRHDDFSLLRSTTSVLAITTAAGLLGWNVFRVVTQFDPFHWWVVFDILAGMIAADFLSGLVHWIADTWGSESMPILGRRFLHPFRVHHVNPDDFLRRRFIDTNGDVAMLVVPILAVALLIPLDPTWGGVLTIFLVAFGGVALLTNQFHQWAHMPVAPPVVRLLQKWGIVLSHKAHQRHHVPPHDTSYCIATGWCNGPLTAINFYPRLERLVTTLTGIRPREDDAEFQAEADGS